MLDEFYVISMKTHKGSTIYVGEGKGNSVNWVFDINEAIWYETEKEAEEFANRYFKNFDKWFIKEVYA